MLTNNEIKLINALQRKKERLKNGLFIVEGIKMVDELIRSNYKIKKIFTTSPLEHESAEVAMISEREIKKISQFATPNQVLALVEIPGQQQPILSQSSIILQDINDPGNLGTIIRTADWFGINQIICSKDSVDCYNPKVVSATMGSIFRSSVFYTDLEEYLKNSSLPSYGAFLEGAPLNELKLEHQCNLVFGSESHGLNKEIEKVINHKTTILGAEGAESLNLSIAVGIYCNHYFQNL
jgi:TrmH family RNA methyltransferase